MNTEGLKTFITLSKYKNFTKTAEALFVAQSTVTNRINELENELGKQLFKRDKKSVSLTIEGTKFLEYATRIIELEEKAINDINTDDKYRDKITIGSTNTIYDCHLKVKISQFMRENSDTSLQLIISHSMTLNEMITDGTIDLAFTYIEYRKKGIECLPFYKDKMILVTDVKNSEYSQGICLNDLPKINYLYCNFTFQGIGEYIKELFPRHHKFSFEINRSANIIPYLYNSDSYSFLPEKLVQDEIANNKLIEIPLLDFEIPQIKSFIIYRTKSKSKHKDEIKKKFLKESEI